MPTKTQTPAAATTNGDSDALVIIDRIAVETVAVPIRGTTPLIVHRFSEKAKRQMLDNMQGRKSPKAPKDPQAEYEAAFYRLDGDRYGLPAVAFKSATVAAPVLRVGDDDRPQASIFVLARGSDGICSPITVSHGCARTSCASTGEAPIFGTAHSSTTGQRC